MAWFTRFTRFGDVHWVFGQEQGCTCGPSSALMCYTKMMKLSPSAASYGDTHPFQKKYEQWLGKPYDGQNVGTFPDGLVSVLNSTGCAKWTTHLYSPADAADAIIGWVGTTTGFGPSLGMNPIIVGINWDGSTASHWVCIDTVRISSWGTMYATVCDPWDADVHVQELKSGDNFVYHAKEQFHVDFGGTHYSYSQPSTGRVKQWPIIHPLF